MSAQASHIPKSQEWVKGDHVVVSVLCGKAETVMKIVAWVSIDLEKANAAVKEALINKDCVVNTTRVVVIILEPLAKFTTVDKFVGSVWRTDAQGTEVFIWLFDTTEGSQDGTNGKEA
jgi:hypothetical protein